MDEETQPDKDLSEVIEKFSTDYVRNLGFNVYHINRYDLILFIDQLIFGSPFLYTNISHDMFECMNFINRLLMNDVKDMLRRSYYDADSKKATGIIYSFLLDSFSPITTSH